MDTAIILDIIIPFHYVSADMIEKLVYSFETQTGINNCNIILVSDSSLQAEAMFTSFDKSSIHNVKQIVSHEHCPGGPGYARNLGLTQVSHEYIAFWDSDDAFKSEFSLELIIKQLISQKDVYTFLLQDCCGSNKNLIVIKTQFLFQKKLFFPCILQGEDGIFVTCALSLTDRVECTDKIVGVWNATSQNQHTVTSNKLTFREEQLRNILVDTLRALCLHYYCPQNKNYILVLKSSDYYVLSQDFTLTQIYMLCTQLLREQISAFTDLQKYFLHNANLEIKLLQKEINRYFLLIQRGINEY